MNPSSFTKRNRGRHRAGNSGTPTAGAPSLHCRKPALSLAPWVISTSLAISLALLIGCNGESDRSETLHRHEPTETQSAAEHEITASDGSSDRIVWLDYDEGMRKVVGTTRFAIIYFDTADCAPCMWMEDSLFSNPEVIAAVNEDFVPIKVQTARSDTVHYQGYPFTESHLRKLFGLAGYPTVLFLEGERNQMVGGQAGIIRPERFLLYLRYHTSKAYGVVTFEEFLNDLHEDSPK